MTFGAEQEFAQVEQALINESGYCVLRDHVEHFILPKIVGKVPLTENHLLAWTRDEITRHLLPYGPRSTWQVMDTCVDVMYPYESAYSVPAFYGRRLRVRLRRLGWGWNNMFPGFGPYETDRIIELTYS